LIFLRTYRVHTATRKSKQGQYFRVGAGTGTETGTGTAKTVSSRNTITTKRMRYRYVTALTLVREELHTRRFGYEEK
jgi:hypothetical protein